MPHASRMAPTSSAAIPVIDFRRRSLMLEWHLANATWTACDDPPTLLYGIALIRASQPNVCVYGLGGQLHVQIGTEQYALSESSPQLTFARDSVSLGLRRRFAVESEMGGELFSHTYWNGQGDDFFRWLTSRASDPQWRSECGRIWSAGVEAAVLRAS